MKPILFSTRYASILNVIIITLIFIACKKETAETSKVQEEIATASSGGNKPVTLQEVSLRVTINDTGNKINSDGSGNYVNGSQNVKAVFDQTGHLYFSTKASNGKPVIRNINYDFGNPFQVDLDPGFTSASGTFMATNASTSFSTFIALQNLTIGQSECVGFSGTIAGSSNNDFYVNFKKGPNSGTNPTSFAIVTHVSTDVWTIVPGDCSISSNTDVAALRTSTTHYGYYHMPFSFTLTKL